MSIWRLLILRWKNWEKPEQKSDEKYFCLVSEATVPRIRDSLVLREFLGCELGLGFLPTRNWKATFASEGQVYFVRSKRTAPRMW